MIFMADLTFFMWNIVRLSQAGQEVSYRLPRGLTHGRLWHVAADPLDQSSERLVRDRGWGLSLDVLVLICACCCGCRGGWGCGPWRGSLLGTRGLLFQKKNKAEMFFGGLGGMVLSDPVAESMFLTIKSEPKQIQTWESKWLEVSPSNHATTVTAKFLLFKWAISWDYGTFRTP